MSGGDQKHFIFITYCKAVALLVVFGHYTGAGFISESYLYLKPYLTGFNMQLFMAVSGFLFFASPTMPYKQLIQRKVKTLVVPYLSIYLSFFFVKIMTGKVFAFSKPATISDLYYVFLEPKSGFESFLWFFYVLFMIMVVAPLVLRIRGGFWVLGAVSLGLYFLDLPKVFSLDLFRQFLFWFWIGGLYVRYFVTMRMGGIVGGLLMGLYTLIGYTGLASVYGVAIQLTQQLLAVFGCMAICQQFERNRSVFARIIEYLGAHSFSLYVWHNSIVMPVIVYVYNYAFKIDTEVDFWVALGLSLVGCALFCPMVSRLLSYHHLTAQLFLGGKATANTGPKYAG